MSHQSDWSYSKQLIKLPLVKGNHVCEDFIPILDRSSLFFYKQKKVFLHGPYSDIADAAFTIAMLRLLREFRIRQISRGIMVFDVFGIH